MIYGLWLMVYGLFMVHGSWFWLMVEDLGSGPYSAQL